MDVYSISLYKISVCELENIFLSEGNQTTKDIYSIY